MTATRPITHTRDARPSAPRGPAVAGVELSFGVVRVVVARREDSRLRVVGKGESVLPDAAISGGLVTDRGAAAEALRAALAVAEHAQRAERVAIALDSDDIRTVHAVTAFEREDSRSPVAASEESRAVREATADAATRAGATAMRATASTWTT
ncbi:MAG: hypothetical protein AAB295_07600, partial [Chloroflexota bacterium]